MVRPQQSCGARFQILAYFSQNVQIFPHVFISDFIIGLLKKQRVSFFSDVFVHPFCLAFPFIQLFVGKKNPCLQLSPRKFFEGLVLGQSAAPWERHLAAAGLLRARKNARDECAGRGQQLVNTWDPGGD